MTAIFDASLHQSDVAGPVKWRPEHVADIDRSAFSQAPLIAERDIARIGPDTDIWDAWPIQEPDGLPAVLADRSTLWMALASPHFDDPDERHGHARIHLLRRGENGWSDLGPAMPDGFSPGSREWSGSAVLEPGGSDLTLYFTATGRRGEAEPTFEQRLFRAHARLEIGGDSIRLVDWRDLEENVLRDPAHYMSSVAGTGAVGTIKAFRDPAFFRDPKDHATYLFFAASAASTQSAFNGVIGVAKAADDRLSNWETLPPLVSADGLNNELERPHVVAHGGLYYLFWSTQQHVFNPDGPTGPNGLYGMVSDRIDGGWQPLNGTGLVFANPLQAPRQAYSWLVMPDLQVTSFIDDWGSRGDGSDGRRFGATFAPMLQIALDGARARLAD